MAFSFYCNADPDPNFQTFKSNADPDLNPAPHQKKTNLRSPQSKDPQGLHL
jgi:hypothetical protein